MELLLTGLEKMVWTAVAQFENRLPESRKC